MQVAEVYGVQVKNQLLGENIAVRIPACTCIPCFPQVSICIMRELFVKFPPDK